MRNIDFDRIDKMVDRLVEQGMSRSEAEAKACRVYLGGSSLDGANALGMAASVIAVGLIAFMVIVGIIASLLG